MLRTGRRAVSWVWHVGCTEKVLLESRLWIDSWNEREDMEKPEELLWRESINEKTVSGICACGCIGEAGFLSAWTPGSMVLGSDFNLRLTSYGPWSGSLSSLFLSFLIWTVRKNRAVTRFQWVNVYSLFVVAECALGCWINVTCWHLFLGQTWRWS